jgi:uncharacterized membrane protein YfcA
VVPVGFAIGAVLGALGGGGSMLAVPVLVYALGENPHRATSASLAVVSVGALAGAVRHAYASRVCWRHAGTIIGAASPGIVAGTLLGNAVGRHVLTSAFVVVMLLGARAMWRDHPDGRQSTPASGDPGSRSRQLTRCLAVGTLIGTIAGFLGVGSGFVVVPMLTTFLAMSMRLAVGTSLVIIAATSFIALIAHLLVGRAPTVSVTVTMSAACGTGAVAGAAISSRLPLRGIRRGFAALLTVVAIYLLSSIAFM